MIPFAVTIEGVTEDDRPVWALAVTEQSLLTATAEGELKWYPLASCKFNRLISPEMPTPVMVVAPAPPAAAPSNGLTLPNRAERRRIDREREDAGGGGAR